MELVYLWVEDYKNIKRQGFNFSPRFACEFEDGTLDITDKEETGESYLKDFFGENINVTAIVGENGSGKSSILAGITKDKIMVEIDGELFSNDFPNLKDHRQLNILDRVKDYGIIYLDFDLIKINPMKGYFDYSNLNIYDKNLYTKMENGNVGDSSFDIHKFRENFYNLIVEHKQTFESKLFIYNPIKIILSDYLHPTTSTDLKWVKINQLIKNVEDISFSKEKFLVFLYQGISRQIPEPLPQIKVAEDLFTYEEDILKHAKYFKIENENIEKIYSFFESLNELQDKSNITISEFQSIYEIHTELCVYFIDRLKL